LQWLSFLAERLISGKGFERDAYRGIKMLEELAVDNIDAKFVYAYKLFMGEHGVGKDFQKGEKLLRSAEQQGHENSRRILAQFILDDYIKPKEEGEGIRLLEKSINDNDYIAMSTLANYYLEGKHVEKNIDLAIKLLNQSVSGKDNHCKVQYALKLLRGQMIPDCSPF